MASNQKYPKVSESQIAKLKQSIKDSEYFEYPHIYYFLFIYIIFNCF